MVRVGTEELDFAKDGDEVLLFDDGFHVLQGEEDRMDGKATSVGLECRKIVARERRVLDLRYCYSRWIVVKMIVGGF